ncbi:MULTISPECIES: helix-turn-helix domain-containing protein [Achromobacter]|uniref:Helix-turn-helix domain-containing protein n=1 Tax=Achromobacter spanius TaxID=217203 RepID=A0ABY8GWW9_9BURK|nr:MULTISPECIES: helix-turn-helix domain-containing protein [Achromobacter]WAI81743.1 helix-turn-helix domain-containing protein [Achromobacter spanius]WEX97261.1 helix-turn-helix domain-containing protein [Achromobacter sp. SS2-2022]WFP09023.1 helix-turn-helix domain-containing protein [Achromobacter spanius]
MEQQDHVRRSAGDSRYFADFATALRYWRDKRGYTQLRLSSESGISQRHISFLESGRSQASREMVLKLGIVLDIPLRERNVMLLAAGYAPAYRERRLSDPELAAVKQALDFMLAQQAPYPALVVDRLWNLVMANAPAAMMMRWLLEMPNGAPLPSEGVNVLKLMLDPNGVRKHLQNWEDVCADLLHWIQREAMSDGLGSEAANLLDELTALPGISETTRVANLDARALPFLPMQIRKDGVALNLFTSIATMGTPHDVTVHELRIESFFPADEATAHWFRERAAMSEQA